MTPASAVSRRVASTSWSLSPTADESATSARCARRALTTKNLKTWTLTNSYNRRPAWLANAHAALDRAVWAAYGWDDLDPAAVPEDEVLARLLALNLERSGLH